MYSQIITVNNGRTKLYANANKEEHSLTCKSLLVEGFKEAIEIKRKTDKIFNCWYLFSEEG